MSDPLKNPHGISPGLDSSRRSGAFVGSEVQSTMLDAGFGQAMWQKQQSFLPVYQGRIVEVIPFVAQYSVRVQGFQDFTCTHGMGGLSNVDCLKNGMGVIIVAFPGSCRGVIIARDPEVDPGGASSDLPGTVLLGGGPRGLAGSMYDTYKNQPDVGGITPPHRPGQTDNLPGDVGSFNQMDVGWLISFGMMLLRASDTAAIELHLQDALMRLHGYNYERFAAGYERRQVDDEGEIHDVEFGVKFPWEANGTTVKGAEAFTVEPQEQWGAYKAGVEPKYPDQTGAWRIQTLRGYLGDMFRQQVLRQPDSRAGEPARYAKTGDGPVALSDVHYSANGAIHLRSAKEILLQKYVLLPAAEQVKLPDDNHEGDWRENYKASGVYGAGDDPGKQEEYKWGEITANKRTAVLDDYLAYVTNYVGPSNLVAHARDWSYPEEGTPSAGWPLDGGSIEPEKLNELRESYWAGVPSEFDVAIDARMSKTRYYKSSAKIVITDDGGITLEDAWGSSLQLCRGNIVLTCPGDIVMTPGRRLVGMGGLDVVIRAKNAIDLTASEGDVRVKAERNLHMLGGNESSPDLGGVLIESRAVQPKQDYARVGEKTVSSGVVLKAMNSQVTAFGQDIYLGATGTGGGNPDLPAIMLDASRAKRPIYSVAPRIIRRADEFIDRYGELERFAYSSAAIWFTQTNNLIVEGNILAAKRDGGAGNMLAEGVMFVKGGLRTNGFVVADRTIVTNELCYATRGFAKHSPDGEPTMVGGSREDVYNTRIAEVDVDFAGAVQQIHGKAEEAAKSEKDTAAASRDKDQPGGGRLLREIAFSLRTDADYAANDFSIHESGWQAMSDVQLTLWRERMVETSVGGPTYPFPGRKHFEESGALLRAARRLFDVRAGRAVARGRVYEEEPQADEKLTLQDYKVMDVRKENT
jgi:hypothetical protein